MEPPVKQVQLSQDAKDRLIRLKGKTGIDSFNILCRWALCRSLSENSPPSPIPLKNDSNLVISWETLAGETSTMLIMIFRQRLKDDGVDLEDSEAVALQFRLHLNRGIGYIAGDNRIKSISDLMALATTGLPQSSPSDLKYREIL
jgi:DNA sulfur modification protein DndE